MLANGSVCVVILLSHLLQDLTARHSLIKAVPAGRRGPTDAEISIDNVNIGFMPAKFTSALAECVLQPQALLIACNRPIVTVGNMS